MASGDVRPGARLDSWKAIAGYLQRDIATVRRWEKSLGLPVRRVGRAGRGHSVFAYQDEIDQWLNASPAGLESAGTIPADADSRPEPAFAGTDPSPRPRWRAWLLTASVLTLGMFGVTWSTRPTSATTGELRFHASPEGVTALDRTGRERWRYAFPLAEKTHLLSTDESLRVIDGGVLVATGMSNRQPDGLGRGGVLRWLDARDGRVRRTFEFDDTITVQRKPYGPPWTLTSFSVHEAAGTRRIAVAGHHWTWDPGLVTVLDEQWQRRGTFAHAGWIEGVRWLSSERLVVGGFSNPHDGGMVALLDTARLDGQGPEPAGSPSHCETCGPVATLRMAIMPRTELNRVTGSRFNRAVLEVLPDRLVVSTVEMQAPDDGAHGGVTAVYEFSRDLDLLHASFSEDYWAMHRLVEQQGKLDHPRERCPDRDGPRPIRLWSPQSGWNSTGPDS